MQFSQILDEIRSLENHQQRAALLILLHISDCNQNNIPPTRSTLTDKENRYCLRKNYEEVYKETQAYAYLKILEMRGVIGHKQRPEHMQSSNIYSIKADGDSNISDKGIDFKQRLTDYILDKIKKRCLLQAEYDDAERIIKEKIDSWTRYPDPIKLQFDLYESNGYLERKIESFTEMDPITDYQRQLTYHNKPFYYIQFFNHYEAEYQAKDKLYSLLGQILSRSLKSQGFYDGFIEVPSEEKINKLHKILEKIKRTGNLADVQKDLEELDENKALLNRLSELDYDVDGKENRAQRERKIKEYRKLTRAHRTPTLMNLVSRYSSNILPPFVDKAITEDKGIQILPQVIKYVDKTSGHEIKRDLGSKWKQTIINDLRSLLEENEAAKQQKRGFAKMLFEVTNIKLEEQTKTASDSLEAIKNLFLSS